MLFAVCLFSLLFSPLNSATIPDQDSGYVDVRTGAHMFWWLYGCNDSNSRDQKPLVMWLQVSLHLYTIIDNGMRIISVMNNATDSCYTVSMILRSPAA